MRYEPLLLGLFLAGASAQQAAEKRTDKAAERLTKNLATVCERLCDGPHTFRGRFRFETTTGRGRWPNLDQTFVGGTDTLLQWHTLENLEVVSNGQQVAAKDGQTAWAKLGKDSPELPLSAHGIAAHLANATCVSAQPSAFDDRPAMRVHAQWHADAADEIAAAVGMPTPLYRSLMQAMARASGRGSVSLVADATVHHDPATKTWLATTLRIAFVMPNHDRPPPTPPAGMPALKAAPIVRILVELQRCEATAAPMPKLDAVARRILGIGDK